jgi:23S rRNA G2445 N2-methylase RlmL
LLFRFGQPLRELLSLRTVSSLYLVTHHDVPRPRALLGDAALRRLLGEIHAVIGVSVPGSYATIHLSAAGSGSSDMRRLVDTIAASAGLQVARREGDLHVRLRRPATGTGWEVLIRLTPRPLSTRLWRVCNMPGALNACVAAAMVLLARPRRRSTVLNPCCGSGTLLVECAALRPGARVIGCDVSAEALICAAANIAAGGFEQNIETHRWDARHLPLADATVDAILVDLPFGHTIGSHRDNQTLHAEILQEAARVARPGARCCLLTHQATLMAEILGATGSWLIERRAAIDLAGLRPTLFLLGRSGLRDSRTAWPYLLRKPG